MTYDAIPPKILFRFLKNELVVDMTFTSTELKSVGVTKLKGKA